MFMGACVWIPKNLWVELGGCPEWFGSIGEDLYLCCRARLAGYRVESLNHSGYRHWVGYSFGGGKVKGDRLATTKIRRALSERNKSFVMILIRSEERRVGKESVSTFRSRRSPYHYKKKRRQQKRQ